MIEYRCDVCGVSREHGGPDYPRGWAGVQVKVEWATGDSGHSEWETDNPVLFCTKCRGKHGGDLEERAIKILRAGLKDGA